MAKTVYEQIKKQNGEGFAKAVRNYHNGILEIPGIVDIVKYAGRDAEPIMNYLISLMGAKIEEQGAYEDPITLLNKAGYDAYYVNTPEQSELLEQYRREGNTEEEEKLVAEMYERKNRTSKYYATAEDLKRMNIPVPSLGPNGEWICTFTQKPDRFEKYYIINAVRKDVDKIKREDFKCKEARDDEYGTSVLSIQMLKTGGFISIKNRYNHTVQNPDNTLNSNPDKIIKGLSQSLKNYFDVDFSAQQGYLPDEYIVVGNQIAKIANVFDGVYIGSDFYVENGIIHPLNKKDGEIMLEDVVILNPRTKTLREPQENGESHLIEEIIKNFSNSEASVIFGEFKDKKTGEIKINITRNKDGSLDICSGSVPIIKVKDGQIIGLNLPTTKELGDDFLYDSFPSLKEFSAPQLETIGDKFLYCHSSLEKIDLPKVKKIGDDFLSYGFSLKEFNAPELEEIGNNALQMNKSLEVLSLPNVKKVGNEFLYDNKILNEINVPELEYIGCKFLFHNLSLEKINLPKVKKIDDDFLWGNEILNEINVPEIEKIGNNFLPWNTSLKILNLPKVKEIGNDFLEHNEKMTECILSEVEKVGHDFLGRNTSLTNLNLPKVKEIGNDFLFHDVALKEFNTPELKKIGEGALRMNDSLKVSSSQNAEEIKEMAIDKSAHRVQSEFSLFQKQKGLKSTIVEMKKTQEEQKNVRVIDEIKKQKQK